ncbi:MAG TPA: hypothetical protein VHR16_00520 [Candidatus Limnocylindrales bacterium]|nr:hypothetical protein [Candidatus Limnocylindrales bacterium]
MEPTPRLAALVLNPTSDEAFRRAVADAVRSGVANPDELAASLRDAYPLVVARRREISHEPQEVWYVYREGSWRVDLTRNDARDDFRAASESLADDAARVRTIEAQSAGLNDDDPTLDDLAQQSDDLTRDMAAKSARQAGLLRESRGPQEQ